MLRKYDYVINKICCLFSKPMVQVVCFLIYKVLVDLIYFIYLGKTSGYGVKISMINILSGYISVLLFSYFIIEYCRDLTPSSLILIGINMIYFIPITTYCSLGLGSSSFMFFAIIFWGVLSFLQIYVPKISLNYSGISSINRAFYVLFILMSLFTIYVSYKYTGFRIITNLLDVYEARAEAATYNMSPWMIYVQHFSSIVIPVLILIAFKMKRYLIVIVGSFLLLLNFSFAGHKSILFMGIMIIIGYIFWRKDMVYIIMPGGIVIGILGLLEYIVFNHAYIISYFFRRQGFVLAQLSDQYYRYFKHNPTDIFRGTILGKLGFESPYNLPIARIIGNNYETQAINCNNGMLADVWAHLGIIGLIIMPIIFVVCFRLFDFVSYKIDSRCFIGLAIYYAVMFCNTTWSTVLLTHGFLIMCILFFLFPRESEGKNKG